MGHSTDRLLPELKAHLKITTDEHDAELLRMIGLAERQISKLTGRTFGSVRRFELHFQTGSLPFVAVPDLRIGSISGSTESWPVSDPVHPEVATILQVATPRHVWQNAAPKPEALTAAAQLVATASASGLMTGAIWQWLAEASETTSIDELARDLAKPGRRVLVPVAAAVFEGWWIQISRRLLVVTKETPDDERDLFELLTPLVDGPPGLLAASEPRLIVARLTEHPVRWAMSARIWIVEDTPRFDTWRLTGLADVTHRHGIPIVSIDAKSTPPEVAAQLLLAAHWHGLLEGDDGAIPPALAAAFPREVERLRRETDSPDVSAAAALLFERLLRPGFDPQRSAASMRRYVRRHVSTLVRAHRSARVAEPPWQRLGISQRHYYKLLTRFASKTGDGRFDVDDTTIERIRRHLETVDRRQTSLEVLRGHGFGEAAARKWLQRHPSEAVSSAWPRRPRP
jgi:hypothetical protein